MASAVTVGYRTLGGTASPGEDFVSQQGTLTIPAGATTGTIGVGILGDVLAESPETFSVQLFDPGTNAFLVDGLAIGTIVDDDSVVVRFIGLGKLGNPFSGESFATGVSNQGVVVGYSPNQSAMTEAFRWEDGVMSGLGAATSQAYAITPNGSAIVGSGQLTTAGYQAFRLQGGSMSGLGDLPGGAFYSSAAGVSADGAVVVGSSQSASASVGGYEAFRWQAGVMTALGDLAGGFFDSRANATSADGAVTAGRGLSASGYEATVWQGTAPTGLGDLPGGTFQSEALAVSADGSVVVGYGNGATGKEAFRWQGGAMTGLGDLPGGQFSSQANAVSADGSIVVGSASDETGPAAMIWTQAEGMRRLADVLAATGAVIPAGWRLTAATAISADGHWVAGYGYNPGGFREAFRASLY
jgi:probable HAF family extracellular repeat protein